MLIGEREEVEKAQAGLLERIRLCSVQVDITDGGKSLRLDQANDAAARLQIISQGHTHVAARAFFAMCSADGRPYGTGTMDFYVYDGRVNLVPSVFIDYLTATARVSRAGLSVGLANDGSAVEIQGQRIRPKGERWIGGFGESEAGFDLAIEQAAGRVVKMGWLRNQYPAFPYLREVDKNPQTDELYERWPLWISQRGAPLGWRFNESSALEVEFTKNKPSQLSILWIRRPGLPIPKGGYQAFNAPLAVILGRTQAEAEARWEGFSRPARPTVESGDLRFYNEVEGVYEVDTGGKNVALSFDGGREKTDRTVLVRLWNLQGNGAHVIKANGEAVPSSLMNDSDIVEDPMVFIVKNATGPARTAVVALPIPRGKKVRLTVESKPGLQFAYQMFSELETYEAWSNRCEFQPLFRLHLKELAVYQASLPGASDYAFFKLPLYFLKNGVNPATFLNELRDFEVLENGPEEIQFALRSVNLETTGLSSYSCTVPNESEKLSFEVNAEFVPLDDGERWTSLEYCDLYPFEDVYRRNFHYRDVTFLTRQGVFDRVGAGAWNMMFRTVEEPERLGYHAEYTRRQGPGSRVPQTQDGSVWILGNNAERGNILFRRGKWEVSAGTEPVFTLCNAWMDVHNSVTGRPDQSAIEKLSYAIDIFPGRVPSLETLNRIYQRDVGQAGGTGIKAVRYSTQGDITGFVPDR
jgi:hypothetical protein